MNGREARESGLWLKAWIAPGHEVAARQPAARGPQAERPVTIRETSEVEMTRTNVNDGTTNAPTCPQQGVTAETNNLDLVLGSCRSTGGAGPAIVFTERRALPVPATALPQGLTGGLAYTTAARLTTSPP